MAQRDAGVGMTTYEERKNLPIGSYDHGYDDAAVQPETDRCSSCESEDLFSGFFDADDLAVSVDNASGTRWTTFCNRCGAEQ